MEGWSVTATSKMEKGAHTRGEEKTCDGACVDAWVVDGDTSTAKSQTYVACRSLALFETDAHVNMIVSGVGLGSSGGGLL